MLKTVRVADLPGKDHMRVFTLREMPALEADRHARAVLRTIDAEPDGGVVALALRHLPTIQALGADALALLAPFAQHADGRPFDFRHDIRDWRSVDRIQQAALLLHVGFLVGRPSVEIPVAMQAASITRSGLGADARAGFCSPHIAAVIDAGLASYRELETVLSTEDAYNLVEIINVRAVQDWRAAQQGSKP